MFMKRLLRVTQFRTLVNDETVECAPHAMLNVTLPQHKHVQQFFRTYHKRLDQFRQSKSPKLSLLIAFVNLLLGSLRHDDVHMNSPRQFL